MTSRDAAPSIPLLAFLSSLVTAGDVAAGFRDEALDIVDAEGAMTRFPKEREREIQEGDQEPGGSLLMQSDGRLAHDWRPPGEPYDCTTEPGTCSGSTAEGAARRAGSSHVASGSGDALMISAWTSDAGRAATPGHRG